MNCENCGTECVYNDLWGWFECPKCEWHSLFCEEITYRIVNEGEIK